MQTRFTCRVFRRITLLFLAVTAAVFVPQVRGQEALKVADFVQQHDRVLQGYGQGLLRFESDTVPYLEVTANRPVFYSTYLKLTQIMQGELERLEQIRHFSNGWTDPTTGTSYPFIPMLGLNPWRIDVSARRDTLAAAFFNELGITEDVMAQFDISAPTYSLSIISLFLQHPELWSSVKDTLSAKGFTVDDVDLEAIAEDGSDEAVYRFIALRDSVMVLANTELLDRGFLFGDLEVMNGTFDSEIAQLGDSVAAVGSPVVIRFLYETIHGLSRNFIFSSETYRAAHERLVSIIRSRGADNAEFVYHANFGNALSLEEWYPGDDLVDWVATSIFERPDQTGGPESQSSFGADHGKPMIVAESGPTETKYRPDNIHHPDVWDDWFVPYFDFLKTDLNTKAFVYIGIDYGTGSGQFSDWGDTRVYENADLFNRYTAELSDETYLHNRDFWDLYSAQTTDIIDVPRPDRFEVGGAFPNPFASNTTFELTLPLTYTVRTTVYDQLGRRVRVLGNNRLPAGSHSLTWDGRDGAGVRVPAGLYLIDVQAEGHRSTIPVLLTR